jgi:hypothetical protein
MTNYESLITVVSVRGLMPQFAHANLIYVGRRCKGWAQSPLRNPIKLTHESQRSEAIAEYRRYLWQKINDNDPAITAELARIATIVQRGEAVRLGCWCHPYACHGDVVKQAVLWWIANKMAVHP